MLMPLLPRNKLSTERGQPARETEIWGILPRGPTETRISETVLKIILQIRLYFAVQIRR